MLYSSVESDNSLFKLILDRTIPILIDGMNEYNIVPSSSYFEEMVKINLEKASIGTVFEGKIIRTGAHAFPDIIAKRYFGVEVKITKEDKWTSTGNSIVESLRESDVERIHIMFGKFGGIKNAKHRLYQECLANIAVTHSPRYTLDMNLGVNNSIFNKMNISYDDFRLDDEKIKVLKSYYKSQMKEGEEIWWIDLE